MENSLNCDIARAIATSGLDGHASDHPQQNSSAYPTPSAEKATLQAQIQN